METRRVMVGGPSRAQGPSGANWMWLPSCTTSFHSSCSTKGRYKGSATGGRSRAHGRAAAADSATRLFPFPCVHAWAGLPNTTRLPNALPAPPAPTTTSTIPTRIMSYSSCSLYALRGGSTTSGGEGLGGLGGGGSAGGGCAGGRGGLGGLGEGGGGGLGGEGGAGGGAVYSMIAAGWNTEGMSFSAAAADDDPHDSPGQAGVGLRLRRIPAASLSRGPATSLPQPKPPPPPSSPAVPPAPTATTVTTSAPSATAPHHYRRRLCRTHPASHQTAPWWSSSFGCRCLCPACQPSCPAATREGDGGRGRGQRRGRT